MRLASDKDYGSILKRITRWFAIDFHIGFTILFRGWGVVSGAMLVVLIPLYLSPSEQGYYFTFSSVIGLQVFFELGLNFVIMQMIAHEMPFVYFDDEGILTGEPLHLSRVHSLIQLLFKWYGVVALLFALSVAGIGFYFFSHHGDLALDKWILAWVGLVIFAAINLFASPFLAVLEGMGRIGNVARLRLIQSIAGTILVVLALIGGLGLNAAPLLSGVAGCFTLIWLFDKRKFLGSLLGNSVAGSGISWREEIFPFQWRIALSWLSGYFIFQLFNPVIFMHQGAEMAGKVGLSLAIFSTILTLSLSWTNAKAPQMAGLVASGKKKELKDLFWFLLIRSTIVHGLLSFGFITIVIAAKYLTMPIVERIAPLEILLLLSVMFFAQQIIGSMALYVRSYKEEPFVSNSASVGVLIFLSLYLGSQYSVYLALVLCCISVLISLFWVGIVFGRYYNRLV